MVSVTGQVPAVPNGVGLSGQTMTVKKITQMQQAHEGNMVMQERLGGGVG